ncbi:MAG TPA: periplasmic heavy metal sensor [Burkholderiales bacterium]|nr:periplasmic heavy metal sensor [Burkholderiales bacterium]
MSRILLLFVLFLASVPGAYAQPSGPDPIAENLFSPEFVMRYAADVGLEEPQRTAIKDALQKAQSRFVDLQWDLQAESGRMVRLLQARPVDEAAVLARADRVMSLEREIKRAHLSLLVRIKNLLSEAQQDKLLALRRRPSN